MGCLLGSTCIYWLFSAIFVSNLSYCTYVFSLYVSCKSAFCKHLQKCWHIYYIKTIIFIALRLLSYFMLALADKTGCTSESPNGNSSTSGGDTAQAGSLGSCRSQKTSTSSGPSSATTNSSLPLAPFPTSPFQIGGQIGSRSGKSNLIAALPSPPRSRSLIGTSKRFASALLLKVCSVA